MTPAQDKAALRQAMTETRALLASETPDAGEALASRFNPRLLERYGPVVSVYWPIRSEIDPRPLIARLRELGAPLSLPRVEADDTLSFRAFTSEDDLERGWAGLLQPKETAEVMKPDLVLAPLLAFDRAGHRLGYGKGHYDRAIKGLRETGRVFFCGLAYEGQGLEQIPAEDHDVPLDWVVTEARNHPLFLARTMTPPTEQ